MEAEVTEVPVGAVLPVAVRLVPLAPARLRSAESPMVVPRAVEFLLAALSVALPAESGLAARLPARQAVQSAAVVPLLSPGF